MPEFFTNIWSYVEPYSTPIGFFITISFALGAIRKRIRHIFQKSKQEKQAADDRFNAEIERLNVIGNDAPGRAQLGFFVLMELGSLRQSLEGARHSRLLSAILTVGVLILFFESTSPGSELAQALPSWLLLFSIAAPFIMICSVGAEHMTVKSRERYILSYQEKVQNIWRESIEKQLQKKKKSSTSPPVETAN